MQRHILTGAPGSGKTAILRRLELDGLAVVEEAATDVMALELARGVVRPWTDPGFIDRIVALQRERRRRATADVQVHDRSPVCTAALALFLDVPVPAALARELDEIERGAIYRREVFFVGNQGFVTPTEARRISLAEALRFERVHREAYLTRGFRLIEVAPGPLEERAAAVRVGIGAPRSS